MRHPSTAWPAADVLTRLIADAQDRHRQGQSRAFDALLTAVRPAFLAFFARHVPGDAAEDLTQVALFRLSNAVPWIVPERADKFVVTLVRNLLRTSWRRRAREGRRAAAVDVTTLPVADAITAADALAEYEDLARTVHRVAGTTLPPALRDVVLGLLRGESSAEIAARLGISPVTVRTRLMRARAILRDELRPYLDRLGGEACDRAG